MRHDKNKAAVFDPNASIPNGPSYQFEFFEESLRRNVIVALDSAPTKSNIAVLRIKAEVLERETRKVLAFSCPGGQCGSPCSYPGSSRPL